jgi:hypothetical protein
VYLPQPSFVNTNVFLLLLISLACILKLYCYQEQLCVPPFILPYHYLPGS